jgi:hypothetical protein
MPSSLLFEGGVLLPIDRGLREEADRFEALRASHAVQCQLPPRMLLGDLDVDLLDLALEARTAVAQRRLLGPHRGKHVVLLPRKCCAPLAQSLGDFCSGFAMAARGAPVTENQQRGVSSDFASFHHVERFDDARLLGDDSHHALGGRQHAYHSRLARVFAEREEERERDGEGERGPRRTG